MSRLTRWRSKLTLPKNQRRNCTNHRPHPNQRSSQTCTISRMMPLLKDWLLDRHHFKTWWNKKELRTVRTLLRGNSRLIRLPNCAKASVERTVLDCVKKSLKCKSSYKKRMWETAILRAWRTGWSIRPLCSISSWQLATIWPFMVHHQSRKKYLVLCHKDVNQEKQSLKWPWGILLHNWSLWKTAYLIWMTIQ